MKANAPEKIYFDGESKACKLPIFSSQNIEYTRTDAFIEKACDFIFEHCDLVNYKVFNPDNKTYILEYDKLIEDVTNYIKGE